MRHITSHVSLIAFLLFLFLLYDVYYIVMFIAIQYNFLTFSWYHYLGLFYIASKLYILYYILRYNPARGKP